MESYLSGSGGPNVAAMVRGLLDEIASLRKQNEEQRRELEQLRAAAPPSLQQPNNTSLPPSTMPRFKDFPLEIREMIWERAVPRRLLGAEDLQQDDIDLPSYPPVPAVAHACRESRRVAASMNHANALPGEFELDLLVEEDETPPPARFRDATPACWTWFSPRNDAFLISPGDFDGSDDDCRVLARAAEHVVIAEHSNFWGGIRSGIVNTGVDPTDDTSANDMLKKFADWVRQVYVRSYPESSRLGGPISSLRTVDFALSEVTRIDRSYPPQFLSRFFGGDEVRVVDLRDAETVQEVLETFGYGLSYDREEVGEYFDWSGEVEDSMDIYEYVQDKLFPALGPLLLRALVRSCFEASKMGSSGIHRPLPRPFKRGGSELDMEVAWVKELSERLTVRPVHVFILTKDM